jgi:hypothetical protein
VVAGYRYGVIMVLALLHKRLVNYMQACLIHQRERVRLMICAGVPYIACNIAAMAITVAP